MMLESEHIYTHAGWQRPVFLRSDTEWVRFAADGVRAIQLSYDSAEKVRRGQACWQDVNCCDGAGGGCELGVIAVRVCVSADEGRLRVVQLNRKGDNFYEC